jgi:hypothetical protein
MPRAGDRDVAAVNISARQVINTRDNFDTIKRARGSNPFLPAVGIAFKLLTSSDSLLRWRTEISEFHIASAIKGPNWRMPEAARKPRQPASRTGKQCIGRRSPSIYEHGAVRRVGFAWLSHPHLLLA